MGLVGWPIALDDGHGSGTGRIFRRNVTDGNGRLRTWSLGRTLRLQGRPEILWNLDLIAVHANRHLLFGAYSADIAMRLVRRPVTFRNRHGCCTCGIARRYVTDANGRHRARPLGRSLTLQGWPDVLRHLDLIATQTNRNHLLGTRSLNVAMGLVA